MASFPTVPRLLTLAAISAVLAILMLAIMRAGTSTGGLGRQHHFRQLALAMDLYAQGEGGWPSLHRRGTMVSPALWRQETLGAFAVLSAWGQGDLPAKAFWQSDLGFPPPVRPAQPDGSGWLDQPAVLTYDWSLPYPALESRPILANRDPAVPYAKWIRVAFVDGSVRTLEALPGHAETPPLSEGDPQLQWSVPYIGDDLLTRTGDGPGMDVVGGGSATRAFLK